MNLFENWFCGSSLWRAMTRREVLPWLLEDTELGEHVLEIGAGAGAATLELRKRAPRVTSLEYSHSSAVRITQLRERNAALQHRLTGSQGEAFGRTDGPAQRAAFAREPARNDMVVQGDAAILPFAAATFSAVIAILMLHHLKSPEAQDRAFGEVRRVLRPSGVFLALDIPNGWLHRIAHIRSTFVPLDPAAAPARLVAAGFSKVEITHRKGAFRLRALREN